MPEPIPKARRGNDKNARPYAELNLAPLWGALFMEEAPLTLIPSGIRTAEGGSRRLAGRRRNRMPACVPQRTRHGGGTRFSFCETSDSGRGPTKEKPALSAQLEYTFINIACQRIFLIFIIFPNNSNRAAFYASDTSELFHVDVALKTAKTGARHSGKK